MKRTPMLRSRIKPIGKKRSKVIPDGREGLTGAKAAGSLPDELRRYGVASATIDNPQGETLPEGSTMSASTSVPDQFKPKMKWSSLNPVGRKRSKVMPDGRERLSYKDWEIRKFDVFVRDGMCCVICRKELFWPEARLNVDHIVKRSIGRNDAMENLRQLCEQCHRARHEAERKRK